MHRSNITNELFWKKQHDLEKIATVGEKVFSILWMKNILLYFFFIWERSHIFHHLRGFYSIFRA